MAEAAIERGYEYFGVACLEVLGGNLHNLRDFVHMESRMPEHLNRLLLLFALAGVLTLFVAIAARLVDDRTKRDALTAYQQRFAIDQQR